MKNKETVLVSTTLDHSVWSAPDGIPQIDVSMLMPNYPGSQSHLFGRLLSIAESPERCLPCKPIVVLFRDRTFEESLLTASLIQSRGWTPAALQRSFLVDPHPIEIVQVPKEFPELSSQSQGIPVATPRRSASEVAGNAQRTPNR